MTNRIDVFVEVPIYKRFTSISSPEAIVLVNNQIEFCTALMDLYYEKFPKYTLHNFMHLKNILELIGKILGDKLNDISSLEAAVIIISVMYHDIGMIYKKEEIQGIETEDTFQIFLDENLKAKLDYQENKCILKDDLIEWYCRWMHAERVWLYLKKEMKWGSISLKDCIGNICESHNKEASYLLDDAKFETTFLGNADLKFCAVLLRLGDILDFDNSRTPKSVYELLDLDNPKNKNEKISSDEWNKHLCSDGFILTTNQGLPQLDFIAGPPHPQIEKNIQTFLDIIEDELKKSSNVISKCSERWRNFRLPLTINRSNIKSENYKKGDFKLSLDESQIIKLLTGENLYDSDFVFIRELLQNAIDTSRMREYHELSSGNKDFIIEPIEVTTWVDVNGFRWVRIDDYGMGINEYTIINHLLKKGNSYYNSDYFKIQKNFFKEKTNKDFTPISRFGIGLLSCFILGDSIEINSRSVEITETKNQEEKTRLSIQGLQSQYILQTEKDKHMPLEMPKEFTFENGFRKKFGTSIAVKIDRKKDHLHFLSDFDRAIKEYVLCSPIKINYKGVVLGIDFESTLTTQLSERRIHWFSQSQKSEIENVIQKKISTEIGISFLPINITDNSTSDNLKGQLVFVKLECEDLLQNNDIENWSFQFVFNGPKKRIEFKKRIKDKITNEDITNFTEITIDDFFNESVNVDIFNSLFQLQAGNDIYYTDRIRIVHNGINVPNESDKYSGGSHIKLKFSQYLFGFNRHAFNNDFRYACFGIIYLQDSLIPELSVARNIIKRLGFSIYSNLYFATKEINNYLAFENDYFNYFDDPFDFFSYKEILEDELVRQKKWDSEKIIKTNHGYLSIIEIKEKISQGSVHFKNNNTNSFQTSLISGLVDINFEVEFINKSYDDSYFLLNSVKTVMPVEQPFKYKPLLFVNFSESDSLFKDSYINKKHWLGKWMNTNQNYLIENFEGYFRALLELIFLKNLNGVNGINSIIQHFRSILSEELMPSDAPIIFEIDFKNSVPF